MAEKIGRIVVPKGAVIVPHEIRAAMVLAQTGFDVEFIPVRTSPTPDVKFKNREWEIKSPKGKSSRTIENNVRAALRQSSNIIIDLSRIPLPEDKCIREIKNLAKLLGKKRRLMVITKSGEIVKFY